MKFYCSILFLCFFSDMIFAQTNHHIRDTTKTIELEDIIITATKQKEKLFLSPVSIESLGLQAIQQSPQPSFFDAIQNLKGLQLITPSMGFKVISARGFANTTNVRFVQMVDGVDNQAPHIGAPIGNSLGPNDLDILKLEIIPGSSLAMYSMNAINGIADFITKNPFEYPGISLNQKLGLNNINSFKSVASYFNETNLRIAKVVNRKIAFKINGTFMKGSDWIANNRLDLNPNANLSTGLFGDNNPGRDLVNVYGDEQGNRKILTLNGKQYIISRTGYAEKEVADNHLKNLKGDISLFYRPTKNTEVSYIYRISNQNNIYQRTNRFRFDNYLTQQHVINFKTNNIQFKSYLTTEDTGDSYNIRSMAENIDRSFKTDKVWFDDFTKQFNEDFAIRESTNDALKDARIFADNGRFEAHTQAFENKINELRQINNWDIGAALKVRAKLFSADFQHDLSSDLLKLWKSQFQLSLMYGVDFRDYNIVPDGNYFINPKNTGNNLNYWKTGGFVQATKVLFNDKLKFNAVIRWDKNQYFTPKVNPRLAIVYTPNLQHSIRASIQNSYRFPSIFEAFSNINSGGRKRIGGLPIMSSGIFEYSYTQSSITAFQNAVQNEVNKNGISQSEAISNNKKLLQKNTYTYLQPENVTGFEIGYRAELVQKRLNIDLDFWHNIYRNLMAQLDANVPKTNKPDSIAFYLQNTSKQDRYRLWTNSKTVSYNYGSSLGVSYQLLQNYKITGNVTYSKLNRKDQNDGLEDGFNTPEWAYNISLGNPYLYKNFGFIIMLRHQNSFLWQSALATETVPSYTTIDAQASVDLVKNTLNFKLGATNITNKYYYSYIGGPSIGGYYYSSLTLNIF